MPFCDRRIADDDGVQLGCLRESEHEGQHVAATTDPDDTRTFVWHDGVDALFVLWPESGVQ